MNYLIQQYLIKNNIKDAILGIDYTLIDRCEGDGVEIENWNLSIPKPEFTKKQISEALSQENLENQKKFLISQRENYLRSSGLYYFPDFPDEVLKKRSLAREEINIIKAATTLASLNQLSEVFE